MGLGSWPKVTPPSSPFSIVVHFVRFPIVWLFAFCYSLGAVLIEKILKTDPDVGKIYVMVKAKDNDTAQKRLQTEVSCMSVVWYCTRAK